MRERVETLSPGAKIGLAAAAVLVYAAVVWFLLVGPKRSEASSLKTQVADAQATLAAKGGGATPSRPAATPAADVIRLAKAMPPSADQAGLVLELSQLAREAGVSLSSIQVGQPAADTSGATYLPVTVVVTGPYRRVTLFMRGARGLVSFGGGRVHATGRLFSVKSVQLAESTTGKFPLLDATIALQAYAYDGPLAPQTPITPPSSQTDSTTSGATAAGATQ